MNDNAHFETVFSTFPLFYFAMVVAGLSYITFAVMMNLIKRSQFLKKVLDGKYDLPENGDNEEEVWKKEPFLSFIKWDRKRCIIQSIVSAVFFVLIIASFIYYLLEVGTKKDLYLFVFTFSLLASCHNLIKSIQAMIDAKKMNKDLKENISADLFNSHFTKMIKAEGIYLYCSLLFDIACIIVFGWMLYSEFV
ncbi:hypothetical protein KZD03_21005 [Escherichia coli]|jgi:hypothetical protein|uniref:Uncharacterized protein n=1 Tax=Enterobacter hormaechei subsp. xiangfangensis TaxID=1296536 RepID=A0A6F8V5T2_9ENTR|nr:MULTISPECIES: hypothetical protein [Enterobacteriaceae]EAA4229986.1 hypothetical protein [Salmonella enterica subsp. enterica serovar Newport]EAB5633860.1 hypothetical protein [Salmonella enterica subsp. enterica serovar Typhimurium]EAQ9863217.1 hypothetical protein [Salmonella enterica]EBG7958448.1 hypothetical protein [Salmonella enterica subsp. enterica serovar Heidelberg]ECE6100798.1 hypothetical protein [Salmonella enterica subsp. arizonae]ECG0841763.1 hypothetical protein [Salmonella